MAPLRKVSCKMAKVKKPLVTIGLLTYNQEKYIASSLEGLLSQEYSPIELIILDDASKDGTALIIEQYIKRLEKKFVRVSFLKNTQNSGNISKNCNHIMMNAKGFYYYGISGDDIIPSYGVRLLYEAFQKHPECSVVHANMVQIDDTYSFGDPIDFSNLLVKGRESGVEPDNFFQKLMCGNCVSAPAVMLRSELFDRYGYHDETIIYEDYEYWLRLSRQEKFYFLNKPIALYRRTASSITNFERQVDNMKIQLAMDSVFLTRKKYIHYLDKDEQARCWQAYYTFYFQLCAQYRYENGIKWLETKGKEMGINLDEYRIDHDTAKKIMQRETEILDAWMHIKNIRYKLRNYFKEQKLTNIAIYGYSQSGRILHEELVSIGIEVKYIIDRKGKMLGCQLPVYTLDELLPSVDAVIIAPVGLYETVAPTLTQKLL